MKSRTRVADTTLRTSAAFALAVLLVMSWCAEAQAQDRMISKEDFIRQLGGQETMAPLAQPEAAPLPGGLRLRGPAGVKAAGEQQAAPAPPRPKEIAISIQFKSDSTEMSGEHSRNQLREAGEAFSSKELRGLGFEIGGHTDSQGSDAYNLELSRKRAQAIKDALCRGFAVDCARLSVRGYGKSQPVAGNDSEAGRAQNRRVVFKRVE